jgi:hypothetical protein
VLTDLVKGGSQGLFYTAELELLASDESVGLLSVGIHVLRNTNLPIFAKRECANDKGTPSRSANSFNLNNSVFECAKLSAARQTIISGSRNCEDYPFHFSPNPLQSPLKFSFPSRPSTIAALGHGDAELSRCKQ